MSPTLLPILEQIELYGVYPASFAVIGIAIWFYTDTIRTKRRLLNGARGLREWAIEFRKGDQVGPLEIPSTNPLKRSFSKIEGLYSDDTKPLILVSEDPVEHLLEDITVEVEHSYGLRLSGAVTGVSLIFTFILIALAVHRIGDSIAAMGATISPIQTVGSADGSKPEKRSAEKPAPIPPRDPSKDMGMAVKEISYKFVISALGVLAALLLNAFSQKAARLLILEAEEILGPLRFVTCPENRFDTQLQLTHERLLRQQLAQLATVDISVRSLSSIQVTVKEFGQDVLEKMRNIITSSIGDSLERLMKEQKDQLIQITDALSSAIASTLESKLGDLMAKLEVALSEMSRKIDGRGADQATDIVKRLEEVIKSGFGGGADGLKNAMEQMATLMPTLQRSLSGALEDLGNTRKSETEAQRIERAEFEKQMRTTFELGATSQARLAQDLGAIIERLGDIGGRTAHELESQGKNVASQLEQAGSNTYSKFSELTQLFDMLKTAMHETLKETQGTLSSVKDSQKYSNEALSRFIQAGETHATASSRMITLTAQLENVASGIKDSPAAMRLAVEDVSKAIESQKLSIQSQSGILSDLMEHFVVQVKSAGDSNVEHMKGALRDLDGAYSKLGGGLADSIDELSANVESLSKTLPQSIAQE